VRRGRQGLFQEMSEEYQSLVDVKQDRVHAGVTLAAEPDASLRRQVITKLEAALGKEVRAHFRSDPGILGGVLVRVGDRVFDGTLKRRLTVLRRKMLTGE
jgi:F-type H+-transporting ATPase subunit delta